MTGRPFGRGSHRTATSSIEALPQIPHEAVATKLRLAARPGSNRRASRTRTLSSGSAWTPGSPYFTLTTSLPVSRPSLVRNPIASSSS